MAPKIVRKINEAAVFIAGLLNRSLLMANPLSARRVPTRFHHATAWNCLAMHVVFGRCCNASARTHQCGGRLSPMGRDSAAATTMRAAAALWDVGAGAIFSCEAASYRIIGRISAPGFQSIPGLQYAGSKIMRL